MPVSIAGMQVGAQVSSSQDIRTCPSASQTIRGHDAQINTTSQPPHMRRPCWIVFIDLTDLEAVFSPFFPRLFQLLPWWPRSEVLRVGKEVVIQFKFWWFPSY